MNRYVKIFLLGFGLAGTLNAKPYLRIIQPYEGTDLPAVSQSFVFGSVLPATATLFINGVRVTPHTNGGFLALIPFHEGDFKIEALASDGVEISTVTRMVKVAKFPEYYNPEYGKIISVEPSGNVVVTPGDTLDFEIKGATQGSASFRIRGVTYPMAEVGEGVFRATYRFQPGDSFENESVTYTLRRKDGKRITGKCNCRVSVKKRRIPRMIELRSDTIMLTGPGSNYGYHLFLKEGTQFEVIGENGPFYKVRMDGIESGWIKKSVSKVLPSGTPIPKSISRNAKVYPTGESTIVEIPLQHVHAYRINQSVEPNNLELTLYGVTADTDRIKYSSSTSTIREIVWRSDAPDTITLDIRTNQKYPWGYDVRYEGTTLILEIRNPPPWTPIRGEPLRGLKIALDAGHSRRNYGTIGPWGNTEASVVLMVAKEARRYLEARGAKVVMIQDGTKELSLQDRIDIAWEEKAHMFISIHADACGEGQIPWDVEGYSTHYYQPQSRLLAEAIHKEYGDRTSFRSQGVWRSNLAVCRTTAMPSVLFEQGFLIIPEFEEIMLTKEHQLNVARTFANAIVEFMKKATE